MTLYWDHIAEESLDPISQDYDFEGYVIYRSTHPQFLDQQTITDVNGSKFLFEPLKMFNGAPARFDLDNDYFGMSDVVYPGRVLITLWAIIPAWYILTLIRTMF